MANGRDGVGGGQRTLARRARSTRARVRMPSRRTSAASSGRPVASYISAQNQYNLLDRRIERELIPAGTGPKEDDPSYAKLPTEIEDALDAFEADTALRDMLGEEFVKVYLAMKRQETARLRDEIPAAEINEYFDLY